LALIEKSGPTLDHRPPREYFLVQANVFEDEHRPGGDHQGFWPCRPFGEFLDDAAFDAETREFVREDKANGAGANDCSGQEE
jgi:hypothetical protein